MLPKLEKTKFEVFETVPDLYLILSPELVILNASNAFLEATLTVRENIVGKYIFVAFPDNPEHVDADGVSKVKFSLEQVLKYKRPHKMEVQRYDVRRPAHLGSGFEEKFWYPIHIPVLNSDNEVEYIIQKVVDITKEIQREEEYKSFVKKLAQQIENVVSSKNQIEIEKEKLYSLFMQAPAIIAVLKSPEHIFELANPRYMELVGPTRQIVGKTIREALPEIEGQGFFKLLDQVYKTKEAYIGNELPAKLDRKGTGELEEVFLNLVYQPAIDLQGQIYGILIHAVDVTEQVKARKKVEESAARFRSLVNAAPIAIGLFVGKDLIIENANKAFIDLIGKGDNIIGIPFREAMPELITENQPFLKIINDVFTTGKMFETLETQVKVEHNGVMTNYYYDFSYSPLLDSNGNVYAVLNIANEVTERVNARKKIQESEERFRTMAEESDILIGLSDEMGKATYFSKAWIDLTGRQINELLQYGWTDLIHPEDKDPMVKVYSDAFNKMETFIGEFRILNKEGNYRWLFIKSFPRFNADGSFVGFISSGIDISERKEAEKNLNIRNEQLTKVNNELDNFIYTASHDLKAPISNLEGLLNTYAGDNEFNVEQQQILNMMFQSIERFKTTIKDLTDISRIQRADLEDKDILSFNEILEEVKLDIRELVASFNPIIDTNFEVAEIYYSRKNLRSIIYNLLSNALKYSSPDRRPEVKLSTRLEQQYIVFKISDNGLGLSKGNQVKIFGMFKRAHQHVEGSRIGLYMIKKMIDNAGGKIEIESEVGKGTILTVSFKNQPV